RRIRPSCSSLPARNSRARRHGRLIRRSHRSIWTCQRRTAKLSLRCWQNGQPMRRSLSSISTSGICAGIAQSRSMSATRTAYASISQDNSKLPYMNPKLSPEERSADLVHRMTLEEKASQLVNQARAIPSLNVPAYDWWSEALHGVSVNGTTEFPEPIGLAATFD